MSETCTLCRRPILDVTGPRMLSVLQEGEETLLPFCPDADGCRRAAVALWLGAGSPSVREIERLELELGRWRLGTAGMTMIPQGLA